MNKVFNTESFIEKASKIHNNFYDYSKVNFINSQTKVKIICPYHGEFLQLANLHTTAKSGCRLCSLVKNNIFCNTEIFIKKAKLKHKDKFDYSKVVYVNNSTKITIICPIHGEFQQTPLSHLKSDCWHCSHVTVFSRTSWKNMCNSKVCTPIVYIIRCFNENENFLKIGRTSRSVRKRFNGKKSMPYSYEVINKIEGTPEFIFDKERQLHKLYEQFKYTPLIEFPGQKECFNISILQDILKH